MLLPVQSRKYGNTTTRFSVICPGSMDRGVQNIRAEAFEQMDYAPVHGVNFIDTADCLRYRRAQTRGRNGPAPPVQA